MKRHLIAAVLLGTALFAPAAVAAVQPPRLDFEAPPRFASTAARLRAAVPSQLGSLMRLTGLGDPGSPIRVVLAPEGSPEAGLAPRWAVGYALGDQGLIVLLPERVPSYPDSSLDDVLLHETAHVLVARAGGGRPRFVRARQARPLRSGGGARDSGGGRPPPLLRGRLLRRHRHLARQCRGLLLEPADLLVSLGAGAH